MSSSCSTVVTINNTDLVLELDIDAHVQYLNSIERKRQDDRVATQARTKKACVVI